MNVKHAVPTPHELCSLAAAALLAALPLAAHALPVTVHFGAQVSVVDPALVSAATAGQMLQGQYRYESTTPDAAGAANVGLYFNAGTMPSVKLGGLAWQASQVDISVSNLPLVDIYRVDGSGTSGDVINAAGAVWRLDSVALTLTDNAGALALFDDLLPGAAFALADFSIRSFTLTFLDASNRVASIQATVTSLTSPVPVVGSLPLVLLALGVAGWEVRGRRSGRGGRARA